MSKRIILSLTLLGLFASDAIQSMEKEANWSIGAHVPVYKTYLIWAKNELERDPYALNYVCATGNLEKAKLLIEAGADVNAKDCRYGLTPLHWSAWEEGHAEVAQLLIEAGAEVNVENGLGDTPLHKYAWEGHTEVAKLLIEAGADVNAKNRLGDTPLHKAAWLDLKSLIFLTILEDFNNIDNNDREDHINSLQSYPYFINILENPSGNLADFCKHTHLEFLENFVGMKNDYNNTALDIAVKGKNQHLPLLLAAAGNFLNIEKAAEVLKDENGVNVLGIADEDLLKGLQEIISDLEQKIDENIEEMLTFKVLKQEMSLEDEPISNK